MNTILTILLNFGLIVVFCVTFASIIKLIELLISKRKHKKEANTPGARAKMALQEGRVQEALRIYADAGERSSLLQSLQSTLPQKWDASKVLYSVAGELLELEKNVEMARRVGVPPSVTDRLYGEAHAAGEILWHRASRISAAASYNVESPRLQEALVAEKERLNHLLESIKDARSGLAELTLAGGGGEKALAQVQQRFRGITDAARTLQDEELA
jgi:hypothetical protein